MATAARGRSGRAADAAVPAVLVPAAGAGPQPKDRRPQPV